MELLDKTRRAEINMDKRLTEADITFCHQQQEAYDKSREGFRCLSALLDKVRGEQYALLHELDTDFRNPYMDNDVFSYSSFRGELLRGRDELSRAFVTTIVRYFERTYHVELNEVSIYVHLVRDHNEEVLNEKWNGYEDIIQDYPLQYEDVLSEIFSELGGQSFEERAESDLISKCQEVSYTTEVQGKRLLISYGVRVGSYQWKKKGLISCYPRDKLCIILEAIAHFVTGKAGAGNKYFPELFSAYCETDGTIHPSEGMDAVTAIKLFKNENVHIWFKSAELAKQFAEKYLQSSTER